MQREELTSGHIFCVLNFVGTVASDASTDSWKLVSVVAKVAKIIFRLSQNHTIGSNPVLMETYEGISLVKHANLKRVKISQSNKKW